MGGEAEGVGAPVGGKRRVGVPALAAVDEVVQGMDIVAVAAVVEITRGVTGLLPWVGQVGYAVLRVLGVEGLDVLVLCVLVLVLGVWVLYVGILRVWIVRVRLWSLHVRVLHCWILRGRILHVRVLGVWGLHV